MSKHTLLGALMLAGVAAAPASGAIFLDDEPGWIAAAGPNIVAPDYSTVAPVDFAPGTQSLGGLFDVTVTGGAVGDAELNDVPNFVFDFDPAGLASVTFEFSTPITGFAAVWSNTFVQDGFSVQTPFNNYALNDIGDPLNSRFIGFTEPGSFTTLTFTTTDPVPGNDFVFFNSFQFAEIPAPGAASLLGIAGIAAMRRRR